MRAAVVFLSVLFACCAVALTVLFFKVGDLEERQSVTSARLEALETMRSQVFTLPQE